MTALVTPGSGHCEEGRSPDGAISCMITLKRNATQLLLPVRVTPKGGRDCVLPFSAGDTAIRVKVCAPPEEGKANAAVIRVLSDALDIPKSRFALVRGDKSREKQFSIVLQPSEDAEHIVSSLALTLATPAEDCLALVD